MFQPLLRNGLLSQCSAYDIATHSSGRVAISRVIDRLYHGTLQIIGANQRCPYGDCYCFFTNPSLSQVRKGFHVIRALCSNIHSVLQATCHFLASLLLEEGDDSIHGFINSDSLKNEGNDHGQSTSRLITERMTVCNKGQVTPKLICLLRLLVVVNTSRRCTHHASTPLTVV